VLSLIAEYGYLSVLFGVMLESAGVPIPGETILIAAGVLAQRGNIDVGDAILLGILGAVIGDQIGYWVGRERGCPFVLRWGHYVLITLERLARAEKFFERHGARPSSLLASSRGSGSSALWWPGSATCTGAPSTSTTPLEGLSGRQRSCSSGISSMVVWTF
jgi:hypothetical protein